MLITQQLYRKEFQKIRIGDEFEELDRGFDFGLWTRTNKEVNWFARAGFVGFTGKQCDDGYLPSGLHPMDIYSICHITSFPGEGFGFNEVYFRTRSAGKK